MRFRKVGLLLLILAVGVALEAAYRIRSHLSLDFGPFARRVLGGRFSGPSYNFQQTLSEPLPAGASVEVANSFGAVRIARGTGKDLVVRLEKVVFLPTESQARALADQIKIEKTLTDQTLRLSTNRSSLERSPSAWEAGFETNFEIEVPEGTAVRVENEHGDVAAADAASLVIANTHGDVAVERVTGATEIRCGHGDVTASAIKDALRVSLKYGDVSVEGADKAVVLEIDKGDATVTRVGSLEATLRHGDIRAEAVAGDASFHGQHAEVAFEDVGGRALVETAYRDVALTRVAGEATVKSSHGSLTAREIGGALFAEAAYGDLDIAGVKGPLEITVDHGSVEVTDIGKGAKIKAPGGDVKLERFAGPVEIASERGSVTLVPASAIVEPISASTRYGAIELSVPVGSRFDLEAFTETGEVRLHDVAGVVPPAGAETDEPDSRRGSGQRTIGKVGGGGSLVKLRATRGDITLQSVPTTASNN